MGLFHLAPTWSKIPIFMWAMTPTTGLAKACLQHKKWSVQKSFTYILQIQKIL